MLCDQATSIPHFPVNLTFLHETVRQQGHRRFVDMSFLIHSSETVTPTFPCFTPAFVSFRMQRSTTPIPEVTELKFP